MTPKFKVGDRVEYIAFPGDRGRVRAAGIYYEGTHFQFVTYEVEWPDDPEVGDMANTAYEWELMPSCL